MLAPHSQQLSQSTCSVTVHILDVDEGPVFKPCFLRLEVKECEEIGTNIGRYVAEDPETGNSEGIWYVSWFNPSRQLSPHSCLLTLHWWDGGENQKGKSEKTHGLR